MTRLFGHFNLLVPFGAKRLLNSTSPVVFLGLLRLKLAMPLESNFESPRSGDPDKDGSYQQAGSLESASFKWPNSSLSQEHLRLMLDPALARPQQIVIDKAGPSAIVQALNVISADFEPELVEKILSATNSLHSFDMASLALTHQNCEFGRIFESKIFSIGAKRFEYRDGNIEIELIGAPCCDVTISTLCQDRSKTRLSGNLQPAKVQLYFGSSQSKLCWQQANQFVEAFGLSDLADLLAQSKIISYPHGNIVSAYFNRSLRIDLHLSHSLLTEIKEHLALDSSVDCLFVPPLRLPDQLAEAWIPHCLQIQGGSKTELARVVNLLSAPALAEISRSGLLNRAFEVVSSKEGLHPDSFWYFFDKLQSDVTIRFSQEYSGGSPLQPEEDEDFFASDPGSPETSRATDQPRLEEEGQPSVKGEFSSDQCGESLEEQGQRDFRGEYEIPYKSKIEFKDLATRFGDITVSICPDFNWSGGVETDDQETVAYEADNNNLPVLEINLESLQNKPSVEKLKDAWQFVRMACKALNLPQLAIRAEREVHDNPEIRYWSDFRQGKVLLVCKQIRAC